MCSTTFESVSEPPLLTITFPCTTTVWLEIVVGVLMTQSPAPLGGLSCAAAWPGRSSARAASKRTPEPTARGAMRQAFPHEGAESRGFTLWPPVCQPWPAIYRLAVWSGNSSTTAAARPAEGGEAGRAKDGDDCRQPLESGQEPLAARSAAGALGREAHRRRGHRVARAVGAAHARLVRRPGLQRRCGRELGRVVGRIHGEGPGHLAAGAVAQDD